MQRNAKRDKIVRRLWKDSSTVMQTFELCQLRKHIEREIKKPEEDKNNVRCPEEDKEQDDVMELEKLQRKLGRVQELEVQELETELPFEETNVHAASSG